jgi:hypothetical protein
MFNRKRGAARAWRRPVAIGAALVATAGMSVGFTMAANATGGGGTTNVHFVNVNPAVKLFTAKSFAANSSFSAVVIGGTTKIPSNATTVELTVTAGGATAGVMNFYPAGNVGGGSGQSLSWGAGGSDTQTIQENVGLGDQLTFALSGGAAKATATIDGYSTEVTAAGISGLDGGNGQVLTNTPSGVTWQNTQIPRTYASAASGVPVSQVSSTVDSVGVTAGSYVVTATYNAVTPVPDFVDCQIVFPNGGLGPIAFANSNGAFGGQYYGSSSTQVTLTLNGGSLSLQCHDDNSASGAYVLNENLIAIGVGG